MCRFAKWFCLLSCLLFLRPALASTRVDAELIDRWGQSSIQSVQHAGHRYYMGQPGREYGMRLHNRSPHRVLAVVSVDGVNVLTGQTASAHQRGYVLAPYATVLIDGWRKNLSEVASFHFAALRHSYAARTGRPNHVGVIGVAVFREKYPSECCRPEPWVQGGTDRERPARKSLSDSYSAGSAEAESPAAAGNVRPSTEAERASDLHTPQTQRLGTGHGARRHSSAMEVKFERASTAPDQQLRLYYDTRQNLIARGIVFPPRPHPVQPLPFPQDGFVPDP